MNWQDVLDVVATASTAAAVVIALFYSARAERRAGESERRQAADERQSEASMVSAWLEPGDSAVGQERLLVLRNGSSGVIYNVAAVPKEGTLEGQEISIGALQPVREVRIGVPLEVGDPYTNPFVLRFTDSAGRRWARASDGSLLESPYRTGPAED